MEVQVDDRFVEAAWRHPKSSNSDSSATDGVVDVHEGGFSNPDASESVDRSTMKNHDTFKFFYDLDHWPFTNKTLVQPYNLKSNRFDIQESETSAPRYSISDSIGTFTREIRAFTATRALMFSILDSIASFISIIKKNSDSSPVLLHENDLLSKIREEAVLKVEQFINSKNYCVDFILSHDRLPSASANHLPKRLSNDTVPSNKLINHVVNCIYNEDHDIRKKTGDDIIAVAERSSPISYEDSFLTYRRFLAFEATEANALAQKLWSLFRTQVTKVGVSNAFVVDISLEEKIKRWNAAYLVSEGTDIRNSIRNEKFYFHNKESRHRRFARQMQYLYSLDAGANAFRNCPHGGESSQNGSVELLAVNEAAPDSANPNQPVSPAMNNTSSASDQKATASALPENNRDDDEQPPPDRSLSDMERGEASSQTEHGNEGTLLSLSKVTKACLFINGELGLASSAIRFTSTKPLSNNASILFSLAELCSVAGFSLCLGGYTLQNTNRDTPRREVAARLLTGAGSVVTACGFLSFMGTQFPEDIMLWLTGALCMIPISVLPFMFKQ